MQLKINAKTMSQPIFHMDCWFEGRVQGVGFRYRTKRVAEGFDVTGTVQNLDDGRVHLHAEGDESEVRSFQSTVADSLKEFIHSVKIETDNGPQMYQEFKIIR